MISNFLWIFNLDCKYVNASDPSFDPSKCGEQCGGNPFSDLTDFCGKGEKCCPSGSQDTECATECGPYDENGILCIYVY